MSAFWKSKNTPQIQRYKITYKDKDGAIHYTVLSARNSDRAVTDFLSYYGSKGDEITDVHLEPDEAES